MGRIKFYIILCFYILCSFKLHAFSDSILHVALQKNIAGSFRNFYADNLGNIYIITTANQVRKYNDKGDSVAVFNEVKRYGTIWSMDVTNPLRIIVYYKDFATAVIVDRFLNIRTSIDLKAAGITQVKAVAQSYDNNIWMFDELENKIKKIDESGKVVFESTDFRLLFDEAVMPDILVDNNKILYLYDKQKGWYLFDYYGAFQKKIPYANWQNVQVNDNILTGTQNNTLCFATINTFAGVDCKQIDMNAQNTIKMQYQLNKLYVLHDNGLDIFLVQ